MIAHLDRSESRRRLAVFLHGFRTYLEPTHALPLAIRDLLPDADLLRPELPYSRMLSTTPLAQVARQVLDEIDRVWSEREQALGEPYEEVLLIGHSAGAVLARKVLVCAHGEVGARDAGAPGPIEGRIEAPFEAPLGGLSARVWAPSVRRVVLFAAMSRGWAVEGVKSRVQALLWNLGSLYGHLKPGAKPTIFDIRRGAPFIVQTRLQWLALMGPTSARSPKVVVVQLLGTKDDVVAPDDNLDFSVDRSDNFFFSLVPGSTHTSIIDVAATAAQGGLPAERRERLRAALLDSPEQLALSSVPRSHMSDQLPPEPDMQVREAVFVIHGIRDLGHWTQKVAARIKGASGGTMRSLTPSYGYFAMAPFVFPWVRRQKAEWLMDQYVEARAAYPCAQFSYVGHSNGTYLLARALQDYPACRVRHVVFAGSVVRSDYDWGALFDQGRVVKVLNYVATTDWVVASVPHGLRCLRWFDLGGAGHTGFDQAALEQEHDAPASDRRLVNLRYVKGEHSAALVESQWDEIAEFVVRGRYPELESPDYVRDQSGLVKLLAPLSPWLLVGTAGGVLLLIGFLVSRAFGDEAHVVGALWAAVLFAVIGALRLVVTRL